MKHRALLFTTILGLLVPSVQALELSPLSQPPTLMVQAVVIAAPKQLAAELLASPDIKNDPAGVLARLGKLASEGKVSYIANPALNLAGGLRGVAESLVHFEAMTSPGGAGPEPLLNVMIQYAAGRLVASVPYRPGVSYFIGSIDPSTADPELVKLYRAVPPEREPSTHLIFVRPQ